MIKVDPLTTVGTHGWPVASSKGNSLLWEGGNDSQDLLFLQNYACKLLHTQLTLEATSLQQTELLTGIISAQDRRALQTACGCLNTLRIRVEALANVTERAVISEQLQLMQTSAQMHPTDVAEQE